MAAFLNWMNTILSKKPFALQIEAVDDVLNQQQIRLYEEKVRRLLMR